MTIENILLSFFFSNLNQDFYNRLLFEYIKRGVNRKKKRSVSYVQKIVITQKLKGFRINIHLYKKKTNIIIFYV